VVPRTSRSAAGKDLQALKPGAAEFFGALINQDKGYPFICNGAVVGCS
jgi:hypothetical protein